jgi:uncharacterized damage-inducible protein DinB
MVTPPGAWVLGCTHALRDEALVTEDVEPLIDEHGRPHPWWRGGEEATLLTFLDHHRATLAWKCRGLDADGLAARTAATTMTLGGLLNHLAYVEDSWFSVVLHDASRAMPWNEVDWETDPDWDWNSAATTPTDELWARWETACERSRTLTATALAAGGLDHVAARQTDPDYGAPNLRWIVAHMIEEYARHNGHADLLREAIDGEVGE